MSSSRSRAAHMLRTPCSPGSTPDQQLIPNAIDARLRTPSCGEFAVTVPTTAARNSGGGAPPSVATAVHKLASDSPRPGAGAERSNATARALVAHSTTAGSAVSAAAHDADAAAHAAAAEATA